MIVNGKSYRSIWSDLEGSESFFTFDQQKLPFQAEIINLKSWEETERAIRSMKVRGAPLIGVTAAFGIWLACCEAEKEEKNSEWILKVAGILKKTRPTAVNLIWAIDRMLLKIFSGNSQGHSLKSAALQEARKIADEDVVTSVAIGKSGLELIREIYMRKKSPVNILTHCNAGWLATVDWGTATAPIYFAHNEGIPVHVWVDETRPRNQGLITSWELTQNHIPNTLIADNTGGLLMMQGKVDMIITGADRVTANGDVANKIGTYLKALAAKDNNIPFYVAFPSSTFDFTLKNGLTEIEIEERSTEELSIVHGLKDQELMDIRIVPEGTKIHNPAFDITPSRLITGLITERGICRANEREISKLYPEFYPISKNK